MKERRFIIKSLKEDNFIDYINLLNEIILEKKWLGTNSTFTYSASYSYLLDRVKKQDPFILIYENSDLIGWADVDRNSNKSGLLAIGIKKEYRNKGIGSYLLNLAIDKSKEYGYERLELRVRAKNERAIYLYKKVGFVQTEFIENGLYLEKEKIDLLKMALDLK